MTNNEEETMTSFFRGMNRSALDLAYNNVRVDASYHARMAEFKLQSDALYLRKSGAIRDIRYGDQPRQRLDWVPCGEKNAPTFVFIHGGYWQNYTKEDLAFVAAGPLARGFNVVLCEYTLAPDASMRQIVNEITTLLDLLQAGVGEVGFGGRPVCLCGHSAGGQLAVLHRSHSAVTLTVAISALFDLEPISLCWLNEKLQLTPSEVQAFSPILQIAPGAATIISVGDAELPELIRQSHDYALTCAERGERLTTLTVADQTHFSILADLADPLGIHMTAIATSNWLNSGSESRVLGKL
jgi:arylformamidase